MIIYYYYYYYYYEVIRGDGDTGRLKVNNKKRVLRLERARAKHGIETADSRK